MTSQNLFYQPETFEREPSTGSTIRDALLKTQMIVEEIQCEANVIHSNLFGQTVVNDPPTPPIGEPSCALDVILHNLDNLNRINDVLKNICDRLGCV